MKYAVQKGSHNTFWAKIYSFIEKHCFKIKSGSIIFVKQKEDSHFEKIDVWVIILRKSKKSTKVTKDSVTRFFWGGGDVHFVQYL